MDRDMFWKVITLLELVLALTVIVLDLFIPTIIILGICAISQVARKQGLDSLGFKKVERPLKMIATIFLLVMVWTLLHQVFTMPILNHLTGSTQDLSSFVGLKGNLSGLLFLLVASWTLAAFGEEIVYRGFLQVRILDLLGNNKMGIVMAVGISSVMFGIAHTEQGTIGIAVTGLDAVFFSLVKLKYDNLWGAVLAHGLSNTIGVVAFFFFGPFYGLW
jgi:membrane protease YdiL (CAAX protease family)